MIEQIAQDVEDWGDGWAFMADAPSRARLRRQTNDHIVDEIEIHESGDIYVFVRRRAILKNGQRGTVSFPVRNAINRRALDYINQQLDEPATRSDRGAR